MKIFGNFFPTPVLGDTTMEFTTVGRLITSPLYDGHWTREIDPIKLFEMDMIFFTLATKIVKDATNQPLVVVSDYMNSLIDSWSVWSYTMLNYTNKPGFNGLVDMLKTFNELRADLQTMMQDHKSILEILDHIVSQTNLIVTK
jgi:hypothetical protein